VPAEQSWNPELLSADAKELLVTILDRFGSCHPTPSLDNLHMFHPAYIRKIATKAKGMLTADGDRLLSEIEGSASASIQERVERCRTSPVIPRLDGETNDEYMRRCLSADERGKAGDE
jgi:hypothetical protein